MKDNKTVTDWLTDGGLPDEQVEPAAHQLAGLPEEQPGRYRTAEEIGAGGMGRVVLAEDRVLGRDIARKELTRVGGVHRFLREARITAQLEHPGIVPVYELGLREDGTPYYTMRRVRGRTLTSALEGVPDLGGRLALLGHFVDLCHAVGYAHSKGVVHRDLKPANVMIGSFGETVVLDWGLVKTEQPDAPLPPRHDTLEVSGDDHQLTQVGAVMGTPAYMSPEQARGDDADARSDVWSLGVILYELLTGQLPFDAPSSEEILRGVQSGRYRPVKQAATGVPAELAAIVHKAMHPEASERYPDAGAMAHDIVAWQNGAWVQAHAYSTPERLHRLATRYRLALGVLAALTAGILGMVMVLVPPLISERNRAERHAQDATAALAQAQRRSWQLAASARRLEGDPTAAMALARIVDAPNGSADLSLLLDRFHSYALPLPAGDWRLAPDGSALLADTGNGWVRWDTRTGVATPMDVPGDGQPFWGPDGVQIIDNPGRLLTQSLDLTTLLFRRTDGLTAVRRGREISLGSAPVYVAALSGRGQFAALVSPDRLTIHDLDNGQTVEVNDSLGANDVGFTGLGGQVAVVVAGMSGAHVIGLDGTRLAHHPGRFVEVMARHDAFVTRRTDGGLAWHTDEVQEMPALSSRAFRREGQVGRSGLVASLTQDERGVLLMPTATNTIPLPVGTGILELQLSQDGRAVAVRTREALRVWHLSRRARGNSMGERPPGVFAVRGDRVWSGSTTRSVARWTLGEGLVKTGLDGLVPCDLIARDDGSARVAFCNRHRFEYLHFTVSVHPNAEPRLVIADVDGDVAPTQTPVPISDERWRLSPDGERVAALVDGCIQVTPLGRASPRPICPGEAQTALEWAGPARVMSHGGGDTVTVWDADAGHVAAVLQQPSVFRMQASTDGRFLVTGSLTEMRFWRSDGTLVRTHPGTWAGAFHGDLAAAVPSERRVDVLPMDGTEPARFGPFDAALRALAFSPSGDRLAVGTQAGEFEIWHLKRHARIAHHTVGSEIRHLAFMDDGQQLAGALADGTIVVWPAPTLDLAGDWRKAGEVTNLRPCKHSMQLRAVVPYPGADVIYADEGTCR